MKKLTDKAKANPIVTTVLTLLLSGSGVTVAANFDLIMSFLNAPARIERMEARQILLINELVQSGKFDNNPFALVNMMYPSKEVIDSIMKGQR